MTKTWCLGGKHYSNTNNMARYEKVNLRTKKLVKIMKGNYSICDCNKSQIFTKKMTGGQDFIKSGKCTHRHRSAMSNSAGCNLNKKCSVLKLHDFCHNPKCKCQKQITFSPNQFQLEGAGFKNTMKKLFKGSQSAWSRFLKPTINTLAPVIGMAVGAKSKNAKVGAATTNILKSLQGGKVHSLTDMNGNGLRLKVM